jgi:uncharacterized membrane protein (DUF2068 family)
MTGRPGGWPRQLQSDTKRRPKAQATIELMETEQTVNKDVSPAAPETTRRSHDYWIIAIAIFKLVKGVLLLIVGIGALSLIHKDVAETVAQWVDLIRVDPDNRHIHGFLVKLELVDARKLEEISAGTFFYAALLLTEGAGLLLKKRWAEYFTIIVTGSFIPMEAYELVRHPSIGKTLLLIFNVVVVWYLINRLKHHR